MIVVRLVNRRIKAVSVLARLFFSNFVVCGYCLVFSVPSQFSSVQSLDQLDRQGDMEDDSEEILFQSFLQEDLFISFGRGRDVRSLMFVHPVIPLPTAASPIFQGALMDDFGEAVVAHDMPDLCKFPSLDSCQKRFL